MGHLGERFNAVGKCYLKRPFYWITLVYFYHRKTRTCILLLTLIILDLWLFLFRVVFTFSTLKFSVVYNVILFVF